jgi:hypothetical protein
MLTKSANLTETGLRALIRNPAAVRSWPAQQMPAFGATITDSDIDRSSPICAT